MALNHIQKLYRIETQLKDKTVEVRYKTRREKSVPLLSQLHTCLMKSAQQVLPKTKLGEAIQYSLNQWKKLVHYTLNVLLSIDNNRAQRAIKPFVIGRKTKSLAKQLRGQTPALLSTTSSKRQKPMT